MKIIFTLQEKYSLLNIISIDLIQHFLINQYTVKILITVSGYRFIDPSLSVFIKKRTKLSHNY